MLAFVFATNSSLSLSSDEDFIVPAQGMWRRRFGFFYFCFFLHLDVFFFVFLIIFTKPKILFLIWLFYLKYEHVELFFGRKFCH